MSFSDYFPWIKEEKAEKFSVKMDGRKEPVGHQPSKLIALEQRIMLDAAAGVVAAEAMEPAPEPASDSGAPAGGETQPAEKANVIEITPAGIAKAEGPPPPPKEIIFVDSAVSDYQLLIEDVNQDNVEVIILDADTDGVEQIANVLFKNSQEGILYEAIHIVSHGSEAALTLGNTHLTLDSMSGKHADELSIINETLNEGSDILIYGCNFGYGDIGQLAATALSSATGADVAASSDDTGAENLGGNWELEVQTGSIESEVIISPQAQSQWNNLMENIIVDTTSDVVNPNDGVTSLREAINQANKTQEKDIIYFDDAVFADPNAVIILSGKQLTITSEVDIIGGDVGTPLFDHHIILDGNNTSRVLENQNTVTLVNLQIQNGGGVNVGGGIFNEGILTLNQSTVSGNSVLGATANSGGGIFNEGILTLNQSTVSGNSVIDPNNLNQGGGIFNEGTLILNQSTVSGNTLLNVIVQRGVGIHNDAGTATIISSTFGADQSIENLAVLNLNGSLFGSGATITTSGTLNGQYNAFADAAPTFTTGANNIGNLGADILASGQQDNGGQTLTLLPGEDAYNVVNYEFIQNLVNDINQQSNLNLSLPNVDQRNFARNFLDGTIDVGAVEIPSISGRVWLDTNEDGLQNLNEVSVEGVTVNLLNSSASDVTDANGIYELKVPAEGSYTIEVELPIANVFTLQNVGSDDTIDSDVNGFGVSGTIVLAAGVVVNDVDAGLVPLTLNLSNVEVTEGIDDFAVFDLSLSKPLIVQSLTVDLSLVDMSATSGLDFGPGLEISSDGGTTWQASTQVIFTPGFTSALVRTPIIDNETVEPVESFKLMAEITAVASADGEGVINDDDGPAVTIEDVSVDESAGTMSFTATLDSAVQGGFDVDVEFTDISATGSVDYANATQTLSFQGLAGEMVNFNVAIVNDTVEEADETFSVNLANLNPALNVIITDTATGEIRDNDSTAVTIEDVSVDESAGTMSFTATLNNAVQGGFDVDVELSDISATGSVDYANATQTLSFQGLAGEMVNFNVAIVNDAVVEADETFSVNLANLNSLLTIDISDTATGEIRDNDSAAVTIEDVSVNESAGTMSFTATLDNAVQGGFDVDVELSDISATGSVDYANATQTLSFQGLAGEMVNFNVAIVNDTVIESNETFILSLSNLKINDIAIANTKVAINSVATATIVDNDGATGDSSGSPSGSGSPGGFPGQNPANFPYYANDPFNVNSVPSYSVALYDPALINRFENTFLNHQTFNDVDIIGALEPIWRYTPKLLNPGDFERLDALWLAIIDTIEFNPNIFEFGVPEYYLGIDIDGNAILLIDFIDENELPLSPINPLAPPDEASVIPSVLVPPLEASGIPPVLISSAPQAFNDVFGKKPTIEGGTFSEQLKVASARFHGQW